MGTRPSISDTTFDDFLFHFALFIFSPSRVLRDFHQSTQTAFTISYHSDLYTSFSVGAGGKAFLHIFGLGSDIYLGRGRGGKKCRFIKRKRRAMAPPFGVHDEVLCDFVFLWNAAKGEPRNTKGHPRRRWEKISG